MNRDGVVTHLRLTGLAANTDSRIPVAIGIPFARGTRRHLTGLGVADSSGSHLTSQWSLLARWPDGSVRWALADFLASPASGAETKVLTTEDEANSTPGEQLDVTETAQGFRIDTGVSVFTWDEDTGKLEAELSGQDTLRQVAIDFELALASGLRVRPSIRRTSLECRGPVRATLRIEGEFPQPHKPGAFHFEGRFSFFAGTGIVKITLTLRNPWPAKHPGGLWDLGDEASLLFASLSLRAEIQGKISPKITWTAETGAPRHECSAGHFEIYQASSGGENWRSRNHVDQSGGVHLPFRGYRLKSAGAEFQGLRASPVVTLEHPEWRLSGAIEQFWQQFPKAIRADGGALQLSFFPSPDGAHSEEARLHEMQGGEQKTHTAFISMASMSTSTALSVPETPLSWVHAPIRVSIDPDYIASTGALGRLVPEGDDPHEEYKALIANTIEGPNSFFAKRELIDDYGWRNFGDVYADHENTHAKDPRPVVSHYNNQYDLVHGLLVQFARSGDYRWFELGEDLARHVVDIDLYHTHLDKPAYNGGFFWHTDHYTDAHRSTHRTYSKDSPQARSGKPYGGGPSNEQNYSTGLLLYHYMTGCPGAREAVLCLARWAHDMDDGRLTVLGVLDPGPTGSASSTASSNYHGPGRGAGNSVRALLDAFELTGEQRHLDKAEELIRRCIHPHDDISQRDFGSLETQWSYLVFLQVLGKYLDVKTSHGQRDPAWLYARHSLATYAQWVLRHEAPYRQRLDRVEFPTETWPAHDVRKSVVLDYAAVYGRAELAAQCREQADFYFRECLAGVASFETRACTRPLAILLQSGYLRAAFRSLSPPPEPWLEPSSSFGPPTCFVGQRDRVKRMLKTPAGLARLAALVLKPVSLLRLVRAVLDRRQA